MQRWFFAEQAEVCVPLKLKEESSVTLIKEETEIHLSYHPWTFLVKISRGLCENEMAAVVGCSDELGGWQLKNCVIMEKMETEDNTWTATVELTYEESSYYRYLIVAKGMCSDEEKTIVRFWEAHLKPRIVPEFAQNMPPRREVFGLVDDVVKIDRGWLTSEKIVQFKCFNAPFSWKSTPKFKQKFLLNVKITPLNIVTTKDCGFTKHSMQKNKLRSSDIFVRAHSIPTELGDIDAEEFEDDFRSEAFSISEVAVLKGTESFISQQPKYGTPCSEEDLLLFHLIIGDFENTAYKVNLFLYSYKHPVDEPPIHFGYSYILPNSLRNSHGPLTVSITCATTHRPIGVMYLGYHIIKPAKSLRMEMDKTFSRYWKDQKFGIHIGHRGTGKSGPNSAFRENTILSMKNAFAHGADMVELDVHLTKDMIPVVYHDHNIRLSYKSKHPDMQNYTLHNGEHKYRVIPISKFTWEQLLNLKDIHEKPSQKCCSVEGDSRQYQCIQMLSDMFDLLPPNLGIDIEIKWPQLQDDCQYEEEYKPTMDRNEYVDCILELVFRKAGFRVIILSCFDADICTMVRFKQNRYPVMQVASSLKSKRKRYMDPRGNCIYLGASQALVMEFLGVVVHVGNLLEEPCQIGIIKRAGIVIFCYGGCGNSSEVRRMLKDWGIHGIIYDQQSDKDAGPSIFELTIPETQVKTEQDKCQDQKTK